MGKAFEIDIECGAGQPVHFTLSEDLLRSHRNPKIAALVAGGERIDLRTAAYQVVKDMVLRNPEAPLEILDGDSIWLIPTGTVRWARATDPDVDGGREPIGFTMRAG